MEEIVKILCQKRKGEASNGTPFWVISEAFIGTEGVCDLKLVQTRGGKKYFITFIDDCTKYCYVYLLRSKDEALETFETYKKEVENQLNLKIKKI